MSDSEEEVEYEPETVTIGSFTFQILTVARMPMQVLMKNASAGVEISGQKVWCGSVGVAQYIIENPAALVRDKAVIELGAGTGVLGMICKRLGASRAYLTDHDDRSLEHMKHDAAANSVDATVMRFDWFSPDMTGLVDSLMSGLDAEARECTDILIVAGDVLYKKMLLEPFFATAKAVLDLAERFPQRIKSAEMVLCHIPRAENSHEMVIEAAQNASLLINEIPRDESWRDFIRCSRCKFDDDDEDDATCPDHDINRAKLYSVRTRI